tara:strand:+ start:62 stop:520 length:459 start_codon:yes stop_codon:yes gene_type:complete
MLQGFANLFNPSTNLAKEDQGLTGSFYKEALGSGHDISARGMVGMDPIGGTLQNLTQRAPVRKSISPHTRMSNVLGSPSAVTGGPPSVGTDPQKQYATIINSMMQGMNIRTYNKLRQMDVSLPKFVTSGKPIMTKSRSQAELQKSLRKAMSA